MKFSVHTHWNLTIFRYFMTFFCKPGIFSTIVHQSWHSVDFRLLAKACFDCFAPDLLLSAVVLK